MNNEFNSAGMTGMDSRHESRRMKDLPATMRPYEKFILYGAGALSDAELLAVIIKTGTTGISSIELAATIIDMACGRDNTDNLAGLTGIRYEDLVTLRGIGSVKALQIMAVIELSRRISKSCAHKRLDFRNPVSIAEYYMEDLRHAECEKLVLVMLDTKLRLIKDEIISSGTVNASIVSPREIFVAAVRAGAVFIVMLHNHPSGDTEPSGNDIAITRRVQLAGEMLGISLIDHIIIGDNRFVSLKESGLMNLNE